MTETWLKPDEISQILEDCPRQYDFFNSPRLSGRGGGVAVIYKKCFTCLPIVLKGFSSFEAQAYLLRNLQLHVS